MPNLAERDAIASLAAAGICGPHQSHSRANVVANIRSAVEGNPDYSFGLSGIGNHSAAEVLGWLADLTGCSPKLDDPEGRHVIDLEHALAGIREAATRLAEAARRGLSLLVVTGHPTGLLEHHMRVVDAYRAAGGKPIALKEDVKLALWGSRAEVRYVGGVGCLSDGASLVHTHSPEAMEELLVEGERPDLVLGDHGFAGAAIEHGIPTIAVMDINDPALAVAWGEGREVLIVPLDDNRPPRLYEPSWRLMQQAILGDRGKETS